MEFFHELLIYSETMETFNSYNKNIPSRGSPDFTTAGKNFDLDEFLKSFSDPTSPPDLFPFHDFDIDSFPNSETLSLLSFESPLTNSNIIEEPDYTYSQISSKRKTVQLPVPFSREMGSSSSDDTLSFPGSDFSDKQNHPISKKKKTEPLDELSASESENSISRDSSSSDFLVLTGEPIEQSQHRGLLVIHHLTALAEAITNNSRDLAEVILLRLRNLVTSTGSNIERIAFYFYHALQWLFTGKNELEVKPHLKVPKDDFLLAYRVLIEIYPCSRLAQFTANQCILEAIPKDSKTLHILDFDTIDGLQWPPLMEALFSEEYSVKHIRLTSIKWADSSENSSLRTFSRLQEFSEELGFDFSSEEVELQDLANCLREEEEVIVANCNFKLFHMFERSTLQVSEFLEASKIFCPRVFTLSYCDFSEDGSSDLMNRLASCLQSASAVCDSLESALPTQDLARQMVERLFLGPRFCRELMFEKKENTVRHVPDNLGLVRGRMSIQNLEQGRDLLNLQAREGHFYRLDTVNPNEISLRWGETSLLSTSAWHVY